MRLMVPIVQLAGRLLRILLYARYSTDEQKRSSIADQFLACRKRLREWGIEDAEIQELSDYEMSGELRSRPGIDQVRLGIQNRAWDLIVAEDSSRLFRNPPACCELVGDAVDRGIRVILPGDDIDTENENFMEDLQDAQSHHSLSNSYSRTPARATTGDFDPKLPEDAGEEVCRTWLRQVCRNFGLGFHLDTPASEYLADNCTPLSGDVIHTLDDSIERAFKPLGHELPYAVCLREFEAMFFDWPEL